MLDERPPRALQWTGYAIVSMMVSVVTIAALVHVDVIIQGSGQLTMDAQPIVLQPLERAVIRSVSVKAGDIVHKGQSVAKLDSTFVEADVTALQNQMAALAGHVKRFEAEASGSAYPSPADAVDTDPMQLAIYRQRQEQFGSRLKAFDSEISRLEAISQSQNNDQHFLEQQLSIAQEVENMRVDLAKQQYTSKLQVLDSTNLRLRAEREHREAISKQGEMQYAISGKRAERQAFMDEWRRNTLEELEKQKLELSRISETLQKATRLQQLVDVTAPEDGVVLEVANRSAGSVLREAEPLVTIIPSHGRMIADVMIKSRDIGYAKIGDEVRIKVDAFPYQRHGLLVGKLRSISENSYRQTQSNDPGLAQGSSSDGATHRARVELSTTTLDKLPEGTRLIPGMTVNAEVKIGTRSILGYFLDPIRRGFHESIREPS